jgi:diaminopimelate decarboxylase
LIEKYFVRDGEFLINGMRLADIVKMCPTPCYVYSAGVIRDKHETIRKHFPGYEVLFSFKANPSLAICKTLQGLGAGADVSSLGEIKAALKVGFKPENIVFVGPAKTEEEIRYALTNGLFAIVGESAYELEMIDRIAGRLRRHANVMVRINTLEKPTAPEIMVGGPSKFGIDEEAAVDALRGIRLKHSTLTGVHVYSASQVLDQAFISQHMTYVADLALRLSQAVGFELKCVDFGGGFGVPYIEGEPELDLALIAGAAGGAREKILAASPACRLVLEVGRYMVAEAGVFLTRVARVKESRGKQFILTNSGMNHFTRPIFQRINHPVRILNKITEASAGVYSIGGPICTPLDVAGRDVRLPAPEVGDIVGFFNAGAYGYSMSMVNFMSLGWPAELMIDTGKAYIIRKARAADEFFDDQPLK